MKPQFHEDYISPKRDPLQPKHADFDWDAVEAALGEKPEQPDTDERLAAIIRKLFQWVTAIDLKKKNSQVLIGRRFIALAWVLDPALFEGSPSASKLAEMLRITRKADLWTLTGEASRHFGITNRGQNHAWNRGAAKPASAQVLPDVAPQVAPDVVKESFPEVET